MRHSLALAFGLLIVFLGTAASVAEAREATIAEFVIQSVWEQITGYSSAAEDKSLCNVRISEDLGRISPVFVYPGTVLSVRAIDDNGHLRFGKGESLQVACPGQGNFLAGLNKESSEAIVRCAGNRMFSLNGADVEINKIVCKKWPENVVYKSGTCLDGKHQLLKTAFNISNGLVPLYESCYDPEMHSTIYSKYILTMDADGAQSGVKRPTWKEVNLFNGPRETNHYRRSAQVKTFAKLLGSEKLAQKYISATSDHFLSKGHLMAKSDHMFGAAQQSTFWYSNAAPQWQTFNGGNWNTLEGAVRKLAARLGKDLTCYTGTYGIATLPDVNGAEVNLYLSADDKTMPVPRLFFKALYEPESRAAIVFAGMNNPYESIESVRNNVRCTDICSSVPWMKWKYQDLTKGYTFCCEVNNFREHYPDVLPSIPAVSLLV